MKEEEYGLVLAIGFGENGDERRVRDNVGVWLWGGNWKWKSGMGMGLGEGVEGKMGFGVFEGKVEKGIMVFWFEMGMVVRNEGEGIGVELEECLHFLCILCLHCVSVSLYLPLEVDIIVPLKGVK